MFSSLWFLFLILFLILPGHINPLRCSRESPGLLKEIGRPDTSHLRGFFTSVQQEVKERPPVSFNSPLDTPLDHNGFFFFFNLTLTWKVLLTFFKTDFTRWFQPQPSVSNPSVWLFSDLLSECILVTNTLSIITIIFVRPHALPATAVQPVCAGLVKFKVYLCVCVCAHAPSLFFKEFTSWLSVWNLLTRLVFFRTCACYLVCTLCLNDMTCMAAMNFYHSTVIMPERNGYSINTIHSDESEDTDCLINKNTGTFIIV